MSVLISLRCLQYRRLIRRWIRKLVEERWSALLYLVAFAGGAAWGYSTLPSALSQAIKASEYPIAAAATRTGLVLLLILIWRQLTRGIRYPPVYLARGDLSVLLAGPFDRRLVIALRLLRAYASAGLSLAVPMILFGPFLVRIWDGMSPARLALIWLHLWVGWICLVNWKWGTFHSARIKRIARVIQWTGYVLAGVVVIALFIVWVVGPRTSPIATSEAALAVAPGLSLSWADGWLLLILSALALLSCFAVWRSLRRVNLEGLVRFSLFVGESLDLYRGNQVEEMQRLAAQMRGERARKRKPFAIGYSAGAGAIAQKAVAMLMRQSPLVLAFPALMFVGVLFAFVYPPILWMKAVVLSVVATSMANFPLVPFHQDLRNWTFARQLPFTATEWVDGNAAILWGWETVLSWIFLWIMWGRGIVVGINILPLMAFLVVAGYLIAQHGILTLVTEVRSRRFLQLVVHGGCLCAFALLAGVVVLLRGTGLPSWTVWVVATGMGIPLAWAWRWIAVRQVQILIEQPWENRRK